MAKGILSCLLFLLTLSTIDLYPVKAGEQAQTVKDYEAKQAAGWSDAPEVSAPSAIVMDADTGMVLYAKDAEEQRYPASITKILTALITLENNDISSNMEFKGDALIKLPAGYVTVEPTEGEVMTIENCLYGLLLESYNDCANALAVLNSGSIKDFAPLMNERAKRAGALNTHFANPSGFAEDDHYTTAYDMAMILKDCAKNPDFRRIAGTVNYTIPATEFHAERPCQMRHEMIRPNSSWYDPRVVAGKTGHTTPAGYCLVTYASDGDLNLVCVVMKCENGKQYASTKTLLDYAFSEFHKVRGDQVKAADVVKASDEYGLKLMEQSRVFKLEISDCSDMLLPDKLSITDLDVSMEKLDPLHEADGSAAKLIFSIGGVEQGSARLHMTGSVNSSLGQMNKKQLQAFRNKVIVLALLLVFMILATITFMRSLAKLKKLYAQKIEEAEAEEKLLEEAQKQKEAEDAKPEDGEEAAEDAKPEDGEEAAEDVKPEDGEEAAEDAKREDGEEAADEDAKPEDGEEVAEAKNLALAAVAEAFVCDAALSLDDYQAAKDAFEAFLDEFDREDPRIALKIVHTYGVVDAAEKIAEGLKLDEENCALAKIIALLHDIGRFEQAKRFDSFEPGLMDHAAYGVELLFADKEKGIRNYVKNDKYDEIIKEAILHHSEYKLPELKEEKTRLHAKIIRDADKLDNCRVKLEESIEILLGESAKEVGSEPISDKVYEAVRSRESVVSSMRETRMDYWLSYLAYFYDINYAVSFKMIEQASFVDKLIDRIPYSEPATAAKMEIIRDELKDYISHMSVYGLKGQEF